MSTDRILIFANGVLPDLEAARRLLKPDALIICADGGARHARALGLIPHLLVGDLDSIDPSDLSRLSGRGVELRQSPHDKDETDLELALGYALQYAPAQIVVIGALGARLDHTLGNISLLADARLSGLDCRLDDGIESVVLCRAQAEIRGTPGDLVSLVPWSGPARGVRTQGLRWPLESEVLYPERSRGISNEMLEGLAAVWVESGSLLIIHRRTTSAVV